MRNHRITYTSDINLSILPWKIEYYTTVVIVKNVIYICIIINNNKIVNQMYVFNNQYLHIPILSSIWSRPSFFIIAATAVRFSSSLCRVIRRWELWPQWQCYYIVEYNVPTNIAIYKMNKSKAKTTNKQTHCRHISHDWACEYYTRRGLSTGLESRVRWHAFVTPMYHSRYM